MPLFYMLYLPIQMLENFVNSLALLYLCLFYIAEGFTSNEAYKFNLFLFFV